MNTTLLELLNRIKGAKLYSSSYRERVYIPYSIDYRPFFVKIKVYFEIVNDKLKLFVDVSSDDYNEQWCKLESERLEKIIHKQFYEIIYNCELSHKNRPLHIRLKDNLNILTQEIIPYYNGALNFLSKMKVSALVSESQTDRWNISIRLAQSRYNARYINKLHVFISHAFIESFKQQLFMIWPNLTMPVLFTSIESLSYNTQVYLNLLEYTDGATMLIIDDCHMFKSPETIRSQRMYKIARLCNYKLIMTNSLIVNNIHDIYMPYKILSDLILGYYHWEDFSKMHIIYGGFDGSEILGYKNLSYLVNMTEPYTYALEEKKTAKRSISVKTYICDLTDKQKYYYKRKKNELLTLIDQNKVQLHDVYRILIEMQKIVCGYVPINKFDKINKLTLLREHTGEYQCIILCKYLFEVDLLINFLGKVNCAVFCGKNSKWRKDEKLMFDDKKKRYLISTLAMQDSKLNDLKGYYDIVFFSPSFKYIEYKRCLTYIRNSHLKGSISVKRFMTNSGIDRKIMENLKRKEKLADQLQELLVNRTKLKDFVACL